MDSKGGEKLDHRAGPTGFKVNTQLLNLNKEDMLHEAVFSDFVHVHGVHLEVEGTFSVLFHRRS